MSSCTFIIISIIVALSLYTVRIGKVYVDKTNVKKYIPGSYRYITEGLFTPKYCWPFLAMLTLMVLGYFCTEHEKKIIINRDTPTIAIK